MTAGPLDDLVAALDAVSAATMRRAGDRFDELARAEAARTPWARYGRMRTTLERFVATDTEATLRIVGSPAAIWAWAEKGIHPHLIAVRGKRRVRRRRSSSSTGRPPTLDLRSGGGSHPVPGPVHHPGHRGFKAWSEAADRLGDELPDLVADALTAAGV